LLICASGCLPKDTRPPPARVLVTVTPSAATKAGALPVATADGWSITFDRVLISIGRVSLDGDSCSIYSEANYQRVVSLIGAPDAQKVSECYALGSCDFGFGVSNADTDALLGVGTTAADFAFLRTAGTDHYGGPSGISMFISGKAQKDDQTLTFAWAFRGRARYRECQNSVDGQIKRGFLLSQSQEVKTDITIHAEALFTESLTDPQAALRFDAIASADALGNHDGEVTLDELSQVGLTDLQQDMTYTETDAGTGMWMNLEDYVYLGAAATVARFEDTGTCTVMLGQRRDD
jgi:hypothetical protein